MSTNLKRLFSITLLCGAWLLTTASIGAHCDTMDGPVVADAKVALEKKDLAQALKWIKSDHEMELKNAFARTLAVRKLGVEARGLADEYFFETLVRLHREGEGAPYTGIKPTGTEVDPVIQAADKALDSGDVNALIKSVTQDVADGIRKRFTAAVEKKRHADHNVPAGREYVAAYVEFVHYVEGIHATAINQKPSHEDSEAHAH